MFVEVIQVLVITCNVEILNSFNPELQFKDTEFAIKNKLTNLLFDINGLNS